MAVVVVAQKGALTGLPSSRSSGVAKAVFSWFSSTGVRANHHRPDRALKVESGDGVVIVSRSGQAARAMFEAPAKGCARDAQPFERKGPGRRLSLFLAVEGCTYFAAVRIASDLSTC